MSRSDRQYERMAGNVRSGRRSASTPESVPEGTRETEASGSQGEIQISRMTVRLDCESVKEGK